MLSDAEQRQLAEIERRLQADDPSFGHRFSAAPRPPSAKWWGLVATGWLAAAAVAACLAMLLRSGGMAIIALSAACLSLGLYAVDDSSRR